MIYIKKSIIFVAIINMYKNKKKKQMEKEKQILLTRCQREQLMKEFDNPTRATLASWMRFRTTSSLAILARERALAIGGRLVEITVKEVK